MSKKIARRIAAETGADAGKIIRFIRMTTAAHAARMAHARTKVAKTKHRENFLVWKNFAALGNLCYLGYTVEETCRGATEVNVPIRHFRPYR